MRLAKHSTAAALLIAGLAACSSFQPAVRNGPGPGWPELEPQRPRVRPPSDGRAPVAPELQRVCRAESVPNGWIVTRYSAGDKECPRADDEGYDVAIIERYAGKAVGVVMVVCADQPTPNGWTRVALPEGRAGGCAGARVSAGSPTTYAMRKAR